MATAFAVVASLSAGYGTASATPRDGTASATARPQTLTGTVKTLIREQHRADRPGWRARGPEAKAPERVRVLHTGRRVVALAPGSLSSAADGSTVTVQAERTTDGAKVLSSTTLAAGATATATAPTVHEVYAAIVIPQGLGFLTAPTEADVRAAVQKVSDYWMSQTGGQVGFTVVKVVPAYTSAFACGADAVMDMWDEAALKLPEAQGVGRHLVVVAPTLSDEYGCDYGIASVGGLNDAQNIAFVSDTNQSLMAHELGHNLGLHHSNSLRCSSKPDATVVGGVFSGCSERPYDDLLDVMGFSGEGYGEGNLNAVHLDGMGLLPTAVTVVPDAATTTHRIAPLSADPAQARALKITDPTGVNYFVDYRTAAGRDVVASTNPYRPALGVEVLREDPSAPASGGSYLLDPSPTSLSSDYTRVVPVNGIFKAASGTLSIVVTAQDSSGASIRVYNGTPGPPVPTTVSNSTVTSAYYGAAYTSSAKVLDQYAKPRVGHKVYLQKLASGSSTWATVGSALTNSYGIASYRYTNTTSGSYRWVTASAVGIPSRYSRSVATTSRLRVTMYQPATSVKRYSYIAIKGSATSAPGRVAYVQYKYGTGAWTTGPRIWLGGTVVSGSLRLSSRGTYYTRIYIPAGPGYAGSVSTAYRTTVW